VRAAPYARPVQATVATFDPDTGGGTVLTDDGRRIPFDGAAFAAGGLRLLRAGQRVRLDLAGGRVVRVTIGDPGRRTSRHPPG
jgi:cold shock CspA family protein